MLELCLGLRTRPGRNIEREGMKERGGIKREIGANKQRERD